MNPSNLPDRLHARLCAISASLSRRSDALGLLALGSVGEETERADAYSDLDFFVVVRAGAKPGYLAHLDWLAAAHPLAWAFRNTEDGYKAVMADGLLCEFAVFDPHELAGIPYAPGRWVWRQEGAGAMLAGVEAQARVPLPKVRDDDWLVGEALSNLLVGMLRYRRGERLAAMRMVQVYALDRVLEWIDRHEVPTVGVRRDPFNADRRFEMRHPHHMADLARWAPGIDGTPQAALALLAQLESMAALPAVVTQHVRALAR